MAKILAAHTKAPSTDWAAYTLVVGAVTTAPTEGSGVVKSALWRRNGDSIEIRYNYSHTGAGSSGSGIYKFPMPVVSGNQVVIDTTKITASATTLGVFGTACGTGHMGEADTSAGMKPVTVVPYDTTNLRLSTDVSGTVTQPWGSAQTNSYADPTLMYSFEARVPIVGWSANDTLRTSDGTKI